MLVRSYSTRIDEPRRVTFIQIHTLLTFIVIAAGTLVTGAGPHAGDSETPRLNIAITTVTAIHGYLVIALIALTIIGIYKKFDGYAQDVQRRLIIFLAIALAQGVVGYAQYLLGVPEVLVIIHLLGSSLLWIAAWRVRLTQFYTSSK